MREIIYKMVEMADLDCKIVAGKVQVYDRQKEIVPFFHSSFNIRE